MRRGDKFGFMKKTKASAPPAPIGGKKPSVGDSGIRRDSLDADHDQEVEEVKVEQYTMDHNPMGNAIVFNDGIALGNRLDDSGMIGGDLDNSTNQLFGNNSKEMDSG